MIRSAVSVLTIAGLFIAATAAGQTGQVKLQAIAEIEIEVETENGEVEIRRVPAHKVVPGNDVTYTITATNVGSQPAGDVVITDPIPEHMVYRAGTAFGTGTEITFSADQGKTFATAEQLLVAKADGTTQPATPEDYTHIRWRFTQELSPGASRFVRFQATLE